MGKGIVRAELEAQNRSSLQLCPSGHLAEGGQRALQTGKCPQASLSPEEKHLALLALRGAPGPLEPWSLQERKPREAAEPQGPLT